MALTSNIAESAAAAETGAERGIVLSGDRGKAFRVARRHTMLVAALRIGLPAASLAMCLYYGYAIVRTTGWHNRPQPVAQPKIDPVNLTMDNPHYEGFNKDGGKYVVRADTAQQDMSQLGSFKLNGIKGEFLRPDKSRTDVAAKWGTFDNKTSILELYDGIEVTSSTGLRARLKRATIETKEASLVSSEPVEVDLPTGNVRANAMSLAQKSRQILFSNGVVTHLVPQEKAKPAATDPARQSNAGTRLLGASGRGPIDIESGELFIDDPNRTARFTGSVVASQAESALSTPELQVTYVGKDTGAEKSASLTDAAAGGTKIGSIVAQGPVVLTHGPGDKATADLLEFDGVNEVAVLSGNVVLTQAPDRKVTCDRAELDSKADAAVLTGNVAVSQGRNELHGRRLATNHKAGRTLLSSPAENGRGAGRITSRFYRSEANAAAAGKKAAAAPAEPPSEGGAAFRTDPKAPIDIDAEVLDVDDHAKVAVYRGGVHAVQGDMSIRSADLTIRYTGNTGAANDPARGTQQPATGAAQQGGAQLTKIEARGKVKITSVKNGQSATGDRAECDMKANTCQLTGDVLLTQAKNVVRGTKLSIDMTTGETRIINTGEAAAAKAQGGEAAAPAPGARPSALFYPKDSAAPPAGSGAAGSGATTSGWQSSTSPAAPGGRKNGP
jgi:LPS export ABC transporter protein LptC/lipopolysaccharide transport protein LptA